MSAIDPGRSRARLVALAGLVVACSTGQPAAPSAGGTAPFTPVAPAATIGPCDVAEPSSPSAYGACEVQNTQYALGSDASVQVLTAAAPTAAAALAANAVTLPVGPESYVVFSDTAATYVVGWDEVGAMYGAFELAEQLRR